MDRETSLFEDLKDSEESDFIKLYEKHLGVITSSLLPISNIGLSLSSPNINAAI